MNKLVLTAVVGAAVGIGSLGVSLYSLIDEKITTRKLRKSLGRIEDMSEEKITEELIRKSVEKASNKLVDEYLKNVDDKVLRIAHSDLEVAARNAVERYSSDIRKKAADEVARQVSNLDVEALKRRVCDQAEKHAMEKFDDCLDKYAKKFEDQMESSRKIYDRIARSALEKDREDKDSLRVVLL